MAVSFRHLSRKSSVLLAQACRGRMLVESLEQRVLLSTANSNDGFLNNQNPTMADIVAALPPNTPVQVTSSGLEIQPTSVAGNYTPDYVMLDPRAQITASGQLAPFATSSPTGMTPAKMRHAYGIDQIMFGAVHGDGTGQTIAIVDAYDYPTAASDLHNFDVAFGLPDAPSLTRVNEDGGTTLPGTDPAGLGNDWEVEEALDVEWAHSMAPGANILLVEVASPTDSDLIQHGVNYARSAPGVVAVTMSFGRGEDASVTGLDQYFTTPTGHNGVTFLASTGDTGSPGGYPAKSPNVVAVGGTTLSVDASGNYISESGWSGSGGGLSTFESQPAYQNGVVTQSSTQRATPDVAFDADPASGAAIYDSYDFGTSTPWMTVGGTSLSSPCWAGIVSIVDQGRALGGVGSMDGIGKTLPRLYAISAGDFHDITTGSNGLSAGVGYDLVTGRGSPIANLLVPQLSAAGPVVVSATPSGVQTTATSSISFTFSGAMDPTSFSIATDVDSFTGPGAVDLRSSITGFSWLNSNTTLQINFTPTTADGTYQLAIGPQILSSGGTPMDQNQNGVAGEASDQYTGTFGYDASPLQVSFTNPANGSLVALPFTTLDVHFNEPFDAATVGVSDLTLSQGSVTAATTVDSTTVRYTLSNISVEGALTVTMAAGAVSKAGDDFPVLGFSETFGTDIGTRAMPTATAVAPSGSLIYQTSSNGTISSATDTDSFTIALDAGQTLTVTLTGTSTLQSTFSVTDPSSNVLGTATAAAPGKNAIIETLTAGTAGTYTIVVGGAAGTTGAYTVGVTLNAAQELGAFGGATNQSLATAQDISGSFVSLGGNASRGAVLGGTVLLGGANGTLLSNNFESGLGGFTIANTLGALWHLSTGRGTQTGHTPTQSLYFGQGETATGGGNYNTGSRVAGTVTSPSFTIPTGSSPSLNFNYVLQTEGSPSFDQALVQISTNGGATFTTLTNLSGTAESTVWKAATPISLAAYAGQTVQLRFSFDTLDNIGNSFEGWYVDDVSVQAGASTALQDYYSINLNAGDAASLALKAQSAGVDDFKVLDSGGNVIASSTTGATNVDRSIANFVATTSGKYYILVSSASGGSPYSLVVTRNAAFDLEPNGAGNPQSLNGLTTALGSVSGNGGGTTPPTQSGTTYTGSIDITGTPLSIGFAGDGSFVGPTIGARLSSTEFLRWGTYLAGFTVGVNGQTYTNDIAAVGGTAFPVVLQNISSGTLHGIRATGVINGSLGFQRTIWWNDGDSYALVYTQLTNNGSAPLNAVAILDNQDPDPNNNFNTANDVVVDANGAFVAGSVSGVGSMALASLDPRAVASAGNGYIVTNPFAVINSPVDPNGAISDTSINLAFNIGTLAPGQSTATSFAMMFGASQAALQTAYAAIATKTVANTGDDDRYSITLAAGQTISLHTLTPADGPNEFANTLDPALDLLDPTGTLVATNDNGGPDGRNALLSYTAVTAGTYTVRVYATHGTGGEYVLSAGNALTLTLPINAHEGDGTLTGTLTASTAPTSDLTISLVSSDPSRLGVPTTITLPAGQTSVSIPLSVIDDALLNGPETVSIVANAPGYFSGSGSVNVHDNETAVLSVSLPTAAREGDGAIAGTITSSAAPTRDIVVQLASNNLSKLSVPATVILKAGQTSVSFTATVADNAVIDGTQNASVTAAIENWTSGNATVAVADNDNFITLTLPASGWEGQTANGTITLGGTSASNLTITLVSGNSTELSVPLTVTVPAGQTSATFSFNFLQDGVKAGTQTVTISATATGLTGANGTIAVHDSTLDHLAFDAIVGGKTAGTPFAVTLRALNIANETIVTYAGVGTLSATGTGGASEPVAPASFAFTAGIWSGTANLTVADPTVTLHAVSSSLSAASTTFAVQAGAVASFTWSNVTSPQIATLPFSETVTAKDAYNNVATGYNGTVALTGLAGTAVSQTILNGLSYDSIFVGTITAGYAFTPSQTVQITAVRSFWGSKVSIWNNLGTLLASQAVTATGGSWTETPLTTPITLIAGTTYVVGAYGVSTNCYHNNTIPTFSWGVINGDYSNVGDGFPNSTNVYTYLVDLKASVGSFTSFPVTPTTATFSNGTWTGNITVGQGATGMHLHADDGSGHTGDSGNFDVIQRTLSFSLPSDVRENDGSALGQISVSPAPASDLVLTLTSGDASRLGVPTTVTLPAGQTSALFPLTILDNTLLDGLEAISITAGAPGYSTATGSVKLHDNESSTLSVIAPLSATEGVGTVVGTVTSSAAPTRDIVVQLSSDNTGRASVPATVTIKAGQTSANFNINIVNNTVIDGTSLVTVGATYDNWVSGFRTLAVQDNDNFITVSLPASGWEGQTFTNGGTVTIGGTLTSPLVVNLASNNAGELGIPATVTIPAGQTSVSFTVSLLQDGLKGGTQNVSVTAVGGGLSNGTANISVHDSTLDHLGLNAIGSPQTAGVAFPVTVSALNISGEAIATFSGNASLTAAGQTGNLTVTPTALSFSAGVATGTVTLTTADPAVKLTGSSSGLTVSSNSFAVQAAGVAGFAWGPVSSSQIVNVPFAETLAARDTYGNTVTNFNGTVNLSGMTGGGGAAPTILLFQQSAHNYFQSALTALGLSVTSFATEGDFDTALASANPATTLAIVDEGNVSISLTPASAFIAAGGHMIVEYWNLIALPSLATSLGATVNSSLLSPLPVYNWGGSSLFTGETNPMSFVETTYNVDGQLLQPTSGNTAVGGFISSPAANEAAIIVGNSGRTLLNGFLIDNSITSAAAIQFAENEIQALLPAAGTPITITPTTASFINGVWSGNITVTQAATGMHLHAVDGASHIGDSNTFNVVLPALANLTGNVIGDGTAQRSMVKSITLTFDHAVTFGAGALTLTRFDGLNIPLSITPSADKLTFTITFSGTSIVGGSLADGRYSLAINASAITDQFGRAISGGNSTINCSRLFGDLDGDGDTDSLDYLAFRNAYGKSAGQAGYLSAFDYDGKGVIDVNDNNAFRLRLGKTI